MSHKSLILLFAIFSFTIIIANAQETSPLIKGSVNISIKQGTIACDFVLANLPDIKNYVIRLNSGMNIHYFRDLKRGGTALDYDADTKDSILSDEIKSYYVHKYIHNSARYIPEELEVKYLGMYPVVADSTSGYMGGDWKGNIAFNGYSIRTDGIQSCWYPELYDKDKRKLYDDVRYDITITCNDCTVLFVNGSKPVKATQAHFVSNVPREMAIYCGVYQTSEQNGIWLLNTGMTKADEQKLFDLANTYQAYYAKQFDIPGKGNLTFVQTTPVADPKQWGFSYFSAPTTINVGSGQYGLQSLFEGNSNRHKQTMAHELAHYYFGTLIKLDGDEFR